MHVEEGQLKEFLLDSGLVSRAQLEDTRMRMRAGETLGVLLVSAGVISEDDLRRSQATVLGIPFVSLERERLEPEILRIVPEPIARSRNIIAFSRDEDSIHVAMLDIEDLPAVDFIRRETRLKILPRLTGAESMRSALLQYQRYLKEEFGDAIAYEAQSFEALANAEGESSEEYLKRCSEHPPIVRIVDTLLRHALVQEASDIHIEPQEKELLVRYRIDGSLHDAMTMPLHTAGGVAARLKMLAGIPFDESRAPREGRFKIENNANRISLHVATRPTVAGEKITLRQHPEGQQGLSFEKLGFHGVGEEHIREALRKGHGLILVAGPKGSGKTTTLYTMLTMLNSPRVDISTIEDPIERQLPRINQTQVRPDVGLTFASGLRTLMRQDPDIIMVGELKDKEAANLAVNAALSGRMVLSSITADSAADAPARLIEMGVPPFLVASTLRAVVGQRLVRRLCDDKEKYTPVQKQLEDVSKNADLNRVLAALKEERVVDRKATWKTIPFYRPKKSAHCENGWRGSAGLYEILPISSALQDLISRGTSAGKIEEYRPAQGGLALLEDGIFKAVQGITSLEEAFQASQK